MVKYLLKKMQSAGGIFSARLFYFFMFFGLFCVLLELVVPAFQSQIAIPIEKIRIFSMSQSGSTLEIHLSFEENNKEFPEELKKYVVSSDKKEIILRFPESERPVINIKRKEIVFSKEKSSFSDDSVFSVNNVPSYPLGPGDSLIIEIYGVEQMRNEVTVDPQGSITLPLLDKIFVNGVTIDQLQDLLKEKYGEYINDPQINILLKEYGSRFVNVIGEVGAPSRIPLKRALRLLDAISMAGGFTEKSGDLELQRRDSDGIIQKKRIFKDSLLGANSEGDNLYLLDGDVVNVLPVSSVYLSGEVGHPQSIMYDKELTLLKAIAIAGGFTQWANKSNIIILRKSESKTETIKIDAEKIEKGKAEDPQLYPNDHIIVKERKLF